MIHLNNDSDNVVTVTLEENAIFNYPYYTWKLKDIATKQEVIFYATDNSVKTAYYNQFTFSVVSISATDTPLGTTYGTIYTSSGDFEYTVYEMQYPFDLNLSNAVGVVETGLLRINATHSTITKNTDTGSVFVVNKNY